MLDVSECNTVEFKGSRNFCEEQISDRIWFGVEGTKIEVEIIEDNLVSVKFYRDKF